MKKIVLNVRVNWLSKQLSLYLKTNISDLVDATFTMAWVSGSTHSKSGVY